MKPRFHHIVTALLLAPLATLHAADAPKPAVKVTQELLNSIRVTPKLIFDPFPAYEKKYLPFAMAASIEVTQSGMMISPALCANSSNRVTPASSLWLTDWAWIPGITAAVNSCRSWRITTRSVPTC
jgi:hypothetical protein